MSYSTTDLLASIKRRCLVPTSQITFLDPDLLAFANEELQMQIVPMMMSMREDYFVTSMDYTLVAGQQNYAIPVRAIGMKLRDAVYVDNNGNISNLSRVALDDVPYFTQNPSPGIPQSFFFEANDVMLFPTPSATNGVVRLFYFQRPSDLVATSAVGTIVGISGNTVTVNQVPATFLNGVLCDFVKGSPGFGTLATDTAITNIASTVLTFSSLPSNLAIGDYVCLAMQSAVAQVPVELQPLLAQRVAIKLLEAIGSPTIQTAQAKLTEMEANISMLLSNRIEGEPTKIQSPNSILNSIRAGF